MNSSATSYYLIATYKDSKTPFFPDNTANEFRVKFINPLRLTGSKWKVAVIEIDFIHVEQFIPDRIKPTHYILEFSDCEGLVINGHFSRAIRLFPHTRKDHMSFEEPFYFPVTQSVLDTCKLNLKAYAGFDNIDFALDSASNIIITLHFKKF